MLVPLVGEKIYLILIIPDFCGIPNSHRTINLFLGKQKWLYFCRLSEIEAASFFVMSAENRKINIHLQSFVMGPSTVGHDFSACCLELEKVNEVSQHLHKSIFLG